MINWIRARLRERSTHMGLVAVALAVALLVVPLHVEGEAAAMLSDNIKWLIGALFVGGLGGVVWQGKP
jgi:hypothetical protein